MKHILYITLCFFFTNHLFPQLETTFKDPTYASSWGQGTSLIDVDNDGLIDIINRPTAGPSNDSICWYRNLGNFEFESKVGIALCPTGGYISTCVGDLNNDGLNDIVAGFANEIIFYKNIGEGEFENGDTIAFDVEYALSLAIGDLDGDGDLDLVSGSNTGDQVILYPNDGEGNFEAQILITELGGTVVDIELADLDNDGDLDIIRGAHVDPEIVWFENIGGEFGEGTVIEGPTVGLMDIEVADADFDGDLDLFSASSSDGRLAYYENIGGGEFAPQLTITMWHEDLAWVRAVDIDNNGTINIFFNSTYGTNNKIGWYELNETGDTDHGFLHEEPFVSEAPYYFPLKLCDFDNDGDLDLLMQSSSAGNKIAENNLYTLTNDNSVTAENLDLYYNNQLSEIMLNWNTKEVKNYSFSLYNVIGNCVFTAENLKKSNFRYNTSQLSHGLYIAVVKNGDTFTKKLIIN